ncbi:MAG TPA: hypothetical protein VK963_03065, partial [Candidatus Saccharimonadales bacterium]|nr:hypothetical protein [Candidatus Saccharimonadales bacterium]
DSDSFDAAAKRQIEADITSDFEAARAGIDQLPEAARLGVLLAYSYYRKLFDKLKSLSPAEVGRGRVRISDATKARLLAQLMARQVLGGRRLKR